ncbi:acyltransferase family protein [Paraburkholderia caribensis]|uniref:acyltransferase family protein n=1 Tax=Paraburkholderia caribensis TaxID=75105 RepID=UPI0034D2C4A3
MVQQNHRRIDDIEALRAFAVMFTLVEHVRYVLAWGNGYVHTFDLFFSATTGVDLFLCISGFVIARSILEDFERAPDNHSFWRISFAFWVRRVYRIWPTSILWVSVILLCSIVFRSSEYFGHFRRNLSDFAGVLTQTQNFHMVGCLPRTECGNAGPWWSLSLEEQFYLLFPFAVFIFRKRLGYFMALVVIAQLFLPRQSWTNLWVFRTDAIALGVLMALFSRGALYKDLNPRYLGSCFYSAITVTTLLFLLASMPGASQKISSVSFSTGMVAIVSAVLVFIASFNGDYIARGHIAKPILLWIGSRSYSIYLIHWFSIYATKTFWWYVEPKGTIFDGKYTLRYLLTWLILTFVLSEMNYRFVETPLRRKGARIAKRMSLGTGISHADVTDCGQGTGSNTSSVTSS